MTLGPLAFYPWPGAERPVLLGVRGRSPRSRQPGLRGGKNGYA